MTERAPSGEALCARIIRHAGADADAIVWALANAAAAAVSRPRP
jgi:hypothetical protein